MAAIGNPIAWGLFHLAGGVKKSVLYAAVYFCIVLSLTALSGASSRGHFDDVLEHIPPILLGVQVAILGGFGSLMIVNTVQADLRLKMLESHRLMPITDRAAAMGYAMTPACTLGLIGAINLVLSGAAAGTVGLSLGSWAAANAAALCSCALMWCAAAAGGFCGNLAGLGVLAPLLLMGITGGNLGTPLPGLEMLDSFFIARGQLFSMKPLSSDVVMALVVATICQVGMALLLIQAAARRFRRQEGPSLTLWLGAGIAAAYTIATLAAVGMASQPTSYRDMETHEKGYMLLLILLVIFSLTIGADVANRAWDSAIGVPLRKITGRSIVVAGLLTAIAVAGVAPMLLDLEAVPLRLFWVGLALLLMVVEAYLWITWLHFRGVRSMGPLLGLAMVRHGAPLMLSGILSVRSTRVADYEADSAAAFFQQLATPGLLSRALNTELGSFNYPAIIVQIALLGVPFALLLRRARQNAPLAGVE